MRLCHLFPTAAEKFQEFYVANYFFFANQNADAGFGFLISEGSKEHLIFHFFAYRDF